MKLSFCLITLNEEDNLPRALKSCADLADEIVVVDSGSDDRTESIAREFEAKWHHQDWLGYVGQKNKALSLAENDWAFVLDADEELSPDLIAEIRAIKSDEAPADVIGYSMPRCVLYEGKWIRHGDWYPDRLVRLFQRSKAKFAGGKVHERLEVEGAIRNLRGELHHFSFKDAADHWARCEKYARLWAETQQEAGRRTGPLAPITRSVFRWFRGYLLKGGFLDGAQGWRIAKMNAREVKLKYETLRELNRGTAG
jgi:glycosyltransferase involved in cell wall biosynthesis